MHRIAKNVGWRNLNEDQVLLVDCLTTHNFLLSHVSALIWRNLENKTIHEIIQVVLDEYDIVESVASNDVQDFLNKLKQKKLIL